MHWDDAEGVPVEVTNMNTGPNELSSAMLRKK